jgi:hypothetical protein
MVRIRIVGTRGHSEVAAGAGSLPPVDLVRAHGKRFALSLALAVAIALPALVLTAASPASAAVCPSFRVLHDDRIGPTVLPAGTYELSTEPGKLDCQEAAQLFARFLQDWDGDLPGSWEVVPRGASRAQFDNHGHPTLLVGRTGGTGGGGNTELGRLCSGALTVDTGSDVGPLFFAKGRYLLYVPTGSAITCRRASALFNRFLASGGTLPSPWRALTQTATFYKPAHPTRSAFRIEPLNDA